MSVDTGGGAGVGGNVDTGSGNFSGRDSQKNSTTVNVDSNAIYLALNELSNRMARLESLNESRFLRAEDHREQTTQQLEDLRDELRRQPAPVQGPTWIQLLTLIAMFILAGALIYFGNGFYLFASKFH